ncbi:MAG TPA: MbcA/ParS/Xre antitoxin family protein [Terriglobales bacterium]|nr:MbcA/ParS/Xre antitoxin family protein [Terriglobales bacterium]
MFGDIILGSSTVVRLHGVAWDQPADLSIRAVQEKLSPVAIRAFFRLASHWELRDEDARGLIGGISNGSFYQLKRGAAKILDQDKLTRVSLLVGIFKALNILYSTKLADAWVQLPNSNPVFGGQTPLAYMLKGGVPSMLRVRQLLDARRGGL